MRGVIDPLKLSMGGGGWCGVLVMLERGVWGVPGERGALTVGDCGVCGCLMMEMCGGLVGAGGQFWRNPSMLSLFPMTACLFIIMFERKVSRSS